MTDQVPLPPCAFPCFTFTSEGLCVVWKIESERQSLPFFLCLDLLWLQWGWLIKIPLLIRVKVRDGFEVSV